MARAGHHQGGHRGDVVLSEQRWIDLHASVLVLLTQLKHCSRGLSHVVIHQTAQRRRNVVTAGILQHGQQTFTWNTEAHKVNSRERVFFPHRVGPGCDIALQAVNQVQLLLR